MPTVAVVPVRSFSVGKQRLGAALTDTQRASLGRALAEQVGGAVESSGLLPLFVTADPEVAEWATGSGFPSIADPDEGLNAAAAAGAEWALAARSRWVVLHSDLPLLMTEDLEALEDAITSGAEVIAPSSDGGTSALSASTPFEFAYGAGSFHRHMTRMTEPVVLARIGFLHDVDSPADLQSAQQHPRGTWIRSVLT
ncbi:MAG: 2-phospho-L-lactate guanylyltransferase [Actinomycetota bacterium]|nr:2-phospho-L-lactate guanylyltransferase [Actinomycetota bacterium]